jgi:hypothetical protein
MRLPLVVTLTLAIGAAPAAAQRESRLLPDGLATGFSAGAVVGDGSALVLGTVHSYRLRARKVGSAMSIAFLPQTLLFLTLTAAGDVGAAYNASMPGATLLLKGGATAFAAIGALGAGAYPGLHVGASLIAGGTGRSGLALDVTHRWIWTEGGPHGLWSFGLGITSLPGIGR